MKAYKCKDIRNIALAGHGGSGKTTLAEALLFKSGSTDRMGKISDGSTVCDCDPEEIKRKISLSTTLAYAEYKNVKINILDTPGQFDFIGGMYEGIRAAETVIIALSAKDGVQVGTIKAFKEAKKQKKGVVFAVTKTDEENADFAKALAGLKSAFGNSVCVLDDADRAAVSELIAESDEELMDKFLDAGEFTDEEYKRGLTLAIAGGSITPVVAVSAYKAEGIAELLDMIAATFPSPADVAGEPGEDGKPVKYDESAPLSAFIFKTVVDQFVGKMSFAKIITGSLKSGEHPVNSATGEEERFGKMLAIKGKKQDDMSEAFAGDIVTLTKLNAKTGNALCAPGKTAAFAQIEFPPAVFFQAVAAKGKGDEAKISSAIKKILEEDRVITYVNNSETRQRVLGGLGDQHLDVAINKMKTKFGVEVELSQPIIAYRETIRKKATGVEGTHKKQSGGAGQYGKVVMDFEPHDGDDLIFEEKIVGGTVSKQFFPAVEKGLRESILHGAVAGYPVVRLKATLVDGKMHPVDSKEVAFISAAKIAFKAGMKLANPCLLEPIVSLKITVGNDNTGDVMGIVNKRRGSVLGTNPDPDDSSMTIVEAEMPEAETTDFALVILQMTKGLGHFTREFARYQELPQMLEAEVIANAPKHEHGE